jgi:transcriptional regulator with XRE-family HTH domain
VKGATTVAEGSPTVRRRELGALLRKLREDQGMSVKQVTEHLLCSPSKVSRIETGQRGATLRDVRDLCELYGVTKEADRDRLMDLAREGKQQGWWQPYDLPYSTYVGLEAEALSIKDYDSAVIPGLLQTPDYARARHEGAFPRLRPEKIEQRIEATLKRQLLLTRDQPPHLWSILDEAVLHRVMGSPEIMREQLQSISRAMEMPNVVVQIVPYAVGAHPALDSVFTILELPGLVPTVVYIEGLLGEVYLEREHDVERYSSVFERLQTIALSAKDSENHIAKMARNYELMPAV